MCELIGAPVQFAIGELFVLRNDGDRFRILCGSSFKHAVNKEMRI